jgi:hypothetical protein
LLCSRKGRLTHCENTRSQSVISRVAIQLMANFSPHLIPGYPDQLQRKIGYGDKLSYYILCPNRERPSLDEDGYEEVGYHKKKEETASAAKCPASNKRGHSKLFGFTQADWSTGLESHGRTPGRAAGHECIVGIGTPRSIQIPISSGHCACQYKGSVGEAVQRRHCCANRLPSRMFIE